MSIGGKAVDWAKRNPRATRMIIGTSLKMMNSNDSGDYGDIDFGGGDSGIDLSGGFDSSAFDVSDMGGVGGDMSGMDFSGVDFSGGIDASGFDTSGIDFSIDFSGGVDTSTFDATDIGGLDGLDITADYSTQSTFDVSGTTDFTPFGLSDTIDGTGLDYTGMDVGTTSDTDMAFDSNNGSWDTGINSDFGLADTTEDNAFMDNLGVDPGIDFSTSVPDFGISGGDMTGDTASADNTEFVSDDFDGGDFSNTNDFGNDDQGQGQDDSASINGHDTFAVESNDFQGSGLGQSDDSGWNQDDGLQDQGQDDANYDLSMDDNTIYDNDNDNGTDVGTNDDSGLGTYDDSGNYDDSVNQDDDNIDTSQFDDNNNLTDQNGDSQPQTADSINNNNNGGQGNQNQPTQNQQSHSQNRPPNKPQHRPQNRPQNRPPQHRPSQSPHKPASTNHKPTISNPRPPNQHLQARPPTVPPPQQANRPTRPPQLATPRPRPQSTLGKPGTGSGLPIIPTQAGMMPLTSAQPIMVPMTYLDPMTGEKRMMLVPMTPMIGATGGMQTQVMPVGLGQGISQAQTQVRPGNQTSQTQRRPTKPVPARRQPATNQIPASQSPRSVSSGVVQPSSKVMPVQSNVKTNTRRVTMPAKPASPSSGLQPVPLQSGKQKRQQSSLSSAPLRTRMVSLPVLDIHSPYHVINHEMMARILAGRQASHKPPQKPPTTNNTTAQSTMQAPSQGSFNPTPPVGIHSQRRRPPPSQTSPLPPPSIPPPKTQAPISNPANFQTTGPSRRLPPPQTQPFQGPSTQNTAQPFQPQIQRDDSSDDATSSTVDIYDTPRDEDMFDARPGNEVDLTEYVSYEDALKFSPVVRSGDTLPSPGVTGKVDSIEDTESQSLDSEVHQDEFRIEVTEQIQSEEIIVLEQNTIDQGQTVERMEGTEVDSFNNTFANYHELGGSTEAAMPEIDSIMDLDEFNKEIEEARLIRLAQLQPQSPAVDDRFVPEIEENLVVEPEEAFEEETVIVEEEAAEVSDEEVQGTQDEEIEADETDSIGYVDENAGIGLCDV